MSDTDNQSTVPFLKTVARHFAEAADLHSYCFVFPNRRSKQFFNFHLEELKSGRTVVMPQTVTITDFVAMFDDKVVATPVEAIFNLYHAYLDVLGIDHQSVTFNSPYTFDKFLGWGNVLLTDFNDVDMFLKDADDLFGNVAKLREIKTDHIPGEVKDMLSRMFNIQFGSDGAPVGVEPPFWEHLANRDDAAGEFVKIWWRLAPIYHRYIERLHSQGLTTAGKQYRSALERIGAIRLGDQRFPFQHVVMVGFNTLSAVEKGIFKEFKQHNQACAGFAHFCWDYNSPAFREDANQATHFMRELIADYPNAIAGDEPEITQFCADIQEIAVPSNVGQAQVVGSIIGELRNNGYVHDMGSAHNTAIVLPDESLLRNLMDVDLNWDAGKVNVTMGYPLRNSSLVQLMRNVARMHSSAREGGYFKDHVTSLLSHPILLGSFGAECARLKTEIAQRKLFTIPETLFATSKLAPLFKTTLVRNNSGSAADDSRQVTAFIDGLKEFVAQLSSPSGQGGATTLHAAFVQQYVEVLGEVQHNIAVYGVPMTESSVFYLIDRLVGMHTVPFAGEPLHGLQIMGMLETRCLDFDNVIILSCNERVLPRKFFSKSFIPIMLRRAHAMSTLEDQESMTAYYFYRLLSRAKHVRLVYSTARESMGSSEPSRFITQMRQVFGVDIAKVEFKPRPVPSSSLHIAVPKTVESVRQELDKFTTTSRDEGSYLMLSASSLKKFFQCPLHFYLHYVEHLADDNPEQAFMDAATFGTIVHNTLQELYWPHGSTQPRKVTCRDIKNFEKAEMAREIKRQIHVEYLHYNKDWRVNNEPDPADLPITGDAVITQQAITLYVKFVLRHDRKLLHNNDNEFFEIIECEGNHDQYSSMKLRDGSTINFTYRPDRIDRINGEGPIRIVDYKTGASDEVKTTDLADGLFGNPKRHSIMQLLIYCEAYQQELEQRGTAANVALQPVIYKVKELSDNGDNTMSDSICYDAQQPNANNNAVKQRRKANWTPITDYRTQVRTEFMEQFTNRIASGDGALFNMQSPFVQAANRDMCKYCNFTDFCRR